MFTEKKFKSLDQKLRFKKTAKILKEAEEVLKKGGDVDFSYISMIIKIAFEEDTDSIQKETDLLLRGAGTKSIIRAINDLKYKALEKGNIPVAEWDLEASPDTGKKRKILPISVYLDNLRSPFNVGSIFRSAESFCFSQILLSPDTPSPEHIRAKRSAMGTELRISWRRCSPEELKDKTIFALETGGEPINSFKFPESGILIIGSEETGVSPELLERASYSGGIVSIPLFGSKKSINVGVAFGIAAFCWSNCFN